MFFKQLFDPASSTYTYLIADDETHEAVLIDPVIEQLERDLKLIREHDLTLKHILETHVHADHITASLALKQATGAQTAVSNDCHAQGYDRMLEDGNVILFGREEILVIATPGHTSGSVSYLWRDRVLTGDTLLIGGCGRTDFQNGSPEALWLSITEKLFRLDDQVLVYPGHDYKGRRVSSVGEEKQFNARVAGKSREEFIAIMNNLNLPVPSRIQEAVPANLAGGVGLSESIGTRVVQAALEAGTPLRSVSAQQLAVLAGSGRLHILDVRTPGEFASLRIGGCGQCAVRTARSARVVDAVRRRDPALLRLPDRHAQPVGRRPAARRWLHQRRACRWRHQRVDIGRPPVSARRAQRDFAGAASAYCRGPAIRARRYHRRVGPSRWLRGVGADWRRSCLCGSDQQLRYVYGPRQAALESGKYLVSRVQTSFRMCRGWVSGLLFLLPNGI